MAARMSIPLQLKAMLNAAGLSSSPTSWSLQSTGGVFSINLSWSDAPLTGSVSYIQQGAPCIIKKKTPSMLRRDKRRQEEYRRKQQQPDSVSSIQTSKVCDTPNSTLPSLSFGDKASQVETIEKINTGSQTAALNVSDKSVQSQPLTSSNSTQTANASEIVKEKPNHQDMPVVENSEAKARRETETVLKQRVKGSTVQYLIKWKSLPHNKNTWVPENQLDKIAVASIEKNEKHIRGPTIPKKVAQISHVPEEQKGSQVETGSSYSLNNIFLPQNYEDNGIGKQTNPYTKCDKVMETKEMIKILSFYPGDHSRYDFVNVLLPGENSEIFPFTQVPKSLFDKAGLSHVYRYMQAQ